jgi:hypothetical protein
MSPVLIEAFRVLSVAAFGAFAVPLLLKRVIGRARGARTHIQRSPSFVPHSFGFRRARKAQPC